MILLNSEKKTMYIQGMRRREGGSRGRMRRRRRRRRSRSRREGARRRREEVEISLSVIMTNRHFPYFPNLFTFRLTFLS